jgi:hypothetical protein
MQEEMTAIERLWEDFELPVRDALHFANGHSYDVALDPDAPSGLTALAPFDLDEMLESDPSLGHLRLMGLPH